MPVLPCYRFRYSRAFAELGSLVDRLPPRLGMGQEVKDLDQEGAVLPGQLRVPEVSLDAPLGRTDVGEVAVA